MTSVPWGMVGRSQSNVASLLGQFLMSIPASQLTERDCPFVRLYTYFAHLDMSAKPMYTTWFHAVDDHIQRIVMRWMWSLLTIAGS